MNAEPLTPGIPTESLADLEATAAAVAAGQKPDPELVRRVRHRARQATEAVRRRCGELAVAVDLVRQTRGKS